MIINPVTKADDDEDVDSKAFVIKSRDISPPATSLTAHDVYIYGGIEDAYSYVDLCNRLRDAKPDKEYFRFRIASPGGSCHGLIALITAIRDCPSIVEMHVDSPSYSAGSTLALCGDVLIMHPNTLLMFHNYSGGDMGKGQELKHSVQERGKWIYNYMRDLHQPFLTKEECDAMEKDQDIWIHAHDKGLKARMKRLAEKQDKHGRA